MTKIIKKTKIVKAMQLLRLLINRRVIQSVRNKTKAFQKLTLLVLKNHAGESQRKL